MIEKLTKNNDDSSSKNDRKGRDMWRVFNHQDNNFDDNELNLDSIRVNRNPTSTNELWKKMKIMN